MAITVTLYSFNKRENSTKRPTSGGTDYSCILIDETSLMAPTFKLEIGSNPIAKNYCYVADFDRYYFISDITSNQGFWYITCKEDVMASYRGTIGSSSHYVLRAASAYDDTITDAMYPAKVGQSSSHTLSGSVLSWSSGHSYILGITGYSSQLSTNQTGSVTYYQFNDKALYWFIYYLMHDLNTYCNISDQEYSDPGVQEALINPIQYVVSCIALPIGMQTSWPRLTSGIDFGYYNCPNSAIFKTDCDVRLVPRAATVTESAEVSIPKHPQASTRGVYLNGAPYSDYIFHCACWGDIPIDPAALINVDYLYYQIQYDVCQGNGRLIISPKGSSTYPISNILYSGYAQVGVPIQITQAIVNPYANSMQYVTDLNAAEGAALGTASSMVTGMNASGLADYNQATVKLVYDQVVMKYPSALNSGSNGSMLSFVDTYKCYLTGKFYRIVDENLTELGRPLYQVKQINTLSGYILCQGADVPITGTQEEAIAINAYMNSGFFYE